MEAVMMIKINLESQGRFRVVKVVSQAPQPNPGRVSQL